MENSVKERYCPFKYQRCRPGCMSFQGAVHQDTGEVMGFCRILAACSMDINLAIGEEVSTIDYVAIGPESGATEPQNGDEGDE